MIILRLHQISESTYEPGIKGRPAFHISPESQSFPFPAGYIAMDLGKKTISKPQTEYHVCLVAFQWFHTALRGMMPWLAKTESVACLRAHRDSMGALPQSHTMHRIIGG